VANVVVPLLAESELGDGACINIDGGQTRSNI
jgi:hypothetical protein